jgi:hypothetical protein
MLILNNVIIDHKIVQSINNFIMENVFVTQVIFTTVKEFVFNNLTVQLTVISVLIHILVDVMKTTSLMMDNVSLNQNADQTVTSQMENAIVMVDLS